MVMPQILWNSKYLDTGPPAAALLKHQLSVSKLGLQLAPACSQQWFTYSAFLWCLQLPEPAALPLVSQTCLVEASRRFAGASWQGLGR